MNPATPSSSPSDPRLPRELSNRYRARRSWILWALAFAAVAFTPSAARAQYMYLDSNGDGVHSAADVITAVGTTQADVWLRTNRNRDGAAATCSVDPNLSFTINSYEFILRAVGGTVAFSNATNLQPGMSVGFGNLGNDTEYYIGFGGPQILPPGDYLLARISVVVASGAPNITIAPTTSNLGHFRYTAFGSACYGLDFDNTLKLGSDWFDTDGLQYSLGGMPNSPPAFGPLDPITTTIGVTAARDVTVADPDGDPVGLSIESGPAFLTLTTLTAIPGQTTARLHALPRRGDEGTYTATLRSTDGSAVSSATVAVDAATGTDHAPEILDPGPLRCVAGTVHVVSLAATDSDGDRISFEIDDGPAFASVIPGSQGRGSATAKLTLRPTTCDVGEATVTLGAVAGGLRSTRSISVHVLAPSAPSPRATTYLGSRAWAVAVGDFNEDGHADIASVDQFSSVCASVLLGDGRGGHHLGWSGGPGGGYVAVATADWTGDGHLDLLAGNFVSAETQFFPGVGDGSFGQPATILDAFQAIAFRVADFDDDGLADVAVGSNSEFLTVLRSDGPSGLRVAHRIEVGAPTPGLAVADFDLDGRLDIAATVTGRNEIVIFFGRGDGTFGDPRTVPFQGPLFALEAGDFTGDGRPDLVTMLFNTGPVYLLVGDGAGGFSPRSVGDGPGGTSALGSTDWNLDGFDDLYAAGESAPLSEFLLGSETGGFSPFAPDGVPHLSYSVAFADFNEDGRPDLVGTRSGVHVFLNATATVTGVAARAFLPNEARVVPMSSSSATLSVRLEPIAATFGPLDIDPVTVRLVSEGTGSIGSVSAITSKPGTVGDTDRNEIDEYPVTFAMADVARLYDALRGRQDVAPSVEGRLLGGMRFCASFPMTIIAKGSGPGGARVDPNPLNPEGTLRFTTDRPSTVTVRLFDVNGRLVRTIWNRRPSPAGVQEVRLDGKDQQGRRLGSGVYFYRIQGDDHDLSGRFTVLK